MKLNQKYIEQLAKGEIALNNTGNSNLELLTQVLTKAFPIDYWKINTNNIYYFKQKYYNLWCTSYTTDLPTIKLEDFLIKELPTENFGIICESNVVEIQKWFESKGYILNSSGFKGYFIILKNSYLVNCTNTPYQYNVTWFTLEEIKQLENNMEKLELNQEIEILGKSYIVNINTSTGNYYLEGILGGSVYDLFKYLNVDRFKWTEKLLGYNISNNYTAFPYCKTLQDLNKLIEAIKEGIRLKDDNMENKVIKGYLAPHSMYNNQVQKGDLFVKMNETTYHCKRLGIGQSLLPKEIVETWEAKYEEQYKKGDYLITTEDDPGKYKPKKGEIFIVDRIEGDFIYFDESNHVKYEKGAVRKTRCRKATEEETEFLKIKLPKINGYEGKLEGDYIIYGINCAKFHKEFFLTLYKLHLNNKSNVNNNRYLKSIELSSNVKITIEQIEQIVKFIENN